MKKRLLFLLTMLFMVSNTEAKISEAIYPASQVPVFMPAKAIQFYEGGILFKILPNGELSYALEQKIKSVYTNRSTRRYALQKPSVQFHKVLPNRAKIIRIGQVPIRFNARGKVASIGEVDIDYSWNKISRVGHLKLHYNRFGWVHYEGSVNPYRKRTRS